MSTEPSFYITITGKHRCALRRRGQHEVRLCSDSAEALAAVHRRLRGKPAQVLITDELTGLSRLVQIDRAAPTAALV